MEINNVILSARQSTKNLRTEILRFAQDDVVKPLRTRWVIGLLLISVISLGCVRVAGGTGVWYQGPEDEKPKTKTVGFDTQDLLPSDEAPGSIET